MKHKKRKPYNKANINKTNNLTSKKYFFLNEWDIRIGPERSHRRRERIFLTLTC